MTRIGLTGGIGNGKSAASDYIKKRGFPVVDTDLIARKLVEPGCEALQEISQAFGRKVMTVQGGLDRSEMAQIVFGSKDARDQLESILHPRIRRQWKEEVAELEEKNCSLVVVVIPLLFETKTESEFDLTLCIGCSSGIQRNRLLARGWSEQECDARIATQWSLERKMVAADVVIWNDGPLNMLHRQIDEVVL